MVETSIAALLISSLIVREGLAVHKLRVMLRRTRFRKEEIPTDLPSVSVCIAARNETHAMTQCLESVIRSHYKKLEIIVLDDGSVDDTSVLIKSFAHAGVRFVQGTPLQEGWIGKNHAFEVLLGEASGELVVFMDVDTVVDPLTIDRIVGYAMNRSQTMVSVIPERVDNWRVSSLFGNLRYLWVLLQHSAKKPAASPGLWMIDRAALIDMGGFAPYASVVQPEMHIARALTPSEAYCLVSNQDLGVSYEKKWTSGRETSIRLLRPMVGGVIPGVVFALVAISLALVPMLAVIGIALGAYLIGGLLAVLWLILATLFFCYYRAVWRRLAWLGALLWPLVLLQEAVFMMLSITAYARGTVTWKGRHLTVATSSTSSTAV